MNGSDFMFVLQILAYFAIFFMKLYNVMSHGESYDIKTAYMLGIGTLILWVFGFVIMAIDYENMLLTQLFRLETWLLMMHMLFMVIELIFAFSNTQNNIRAPFSNKQKL